MSGIKGSAMESVVADVLRLVEEGRIPRDELEARLTDEDLAVLDEKMLGALWYPLGTWGRLTELLLEIEGRGDSAYLVERGRRAAARLKSSGVYAQLKGDRETFGERLGAILATLGSAMYKDTHWRYRRGASAEHFRVEGQVPPEFPHVGIFPIQGFAEYICEELDLAVSISLHRESPTLVVMEGRPA